MNKLLKVGLIIVSAVILLPSCATIVGGGNYYAKVQVPNYPLAKIEHNGVYRGTGEANFKAVRRETNDFEISVQQEGCEKQTTKFTQRQFRGWAFAGTVITWTGLSVNGVFLPIPFGVIVDGAVGSWWKPDINEKGVSKQDFNHFVYQIDYTGCPITQTQDRFLQRNSSQTIEKSKAERIRELHKLLTDEIITQEEFENEKQKILTEQ